MACASMEGGWSHICKSRVAYPQERQVRVLGRSAVLQHPLEQRHGNVQPPLLRQNLRHLVATERAGNIEEHSSYCGYGGGIVMQPRVVLNSVRSEVLQTAAGAGASGPHHGAHLHAEVQALSSRTPQQRLLAAQWPALQQSVHDLPLRRALGR